MTRMETTFIWRLAIRFLPRMTFERSRRIGALLFLIALVLTSLRFAPPAVRGAATAAPPPFAWDVGTADATEGAGLYTSLVLDAESHPLISYVNELDGTLRIASDRNGTWTSEIVAGPTSYAGNTNVVIGPNRTLEVSYFDAGTGVVMYGAKGATGWTLTRIDAGFYEGYNRLALNPEGQPAIAYTAYGGDLRFASWNGTAWSIETVDSQATFARYEDLVFDPLDRPHISYYGNGTLLHAVRTASGWTREVVDPTEFSGWYSRIRIDTSGWPHIAYYASANTSLMYASQGLSGWTRSLVDASGDDGIDLSFVLDPTGRAQIAYYDRLAGSLRYAIQTANGWVCETVDRGGVTGWYTGLATDALGLPRISYYNWSSATLRYATGSVTLQVRSLGYTKVSLTAAILRGELVALGNGSAATVGFDVRVAGSPNWTYESVGNLSRAQPFTFALSNLTTDTRYEFRAVGSTGNDTSIGATLPLRIVPPPPPPPDFVTPALLVLAWNAAAITAVLVWRWRRRPKEPKDVRRSYIAR